MHLHSDWPGRILSEQDWCYQGQRWCSQKFIQIRLECTHLFSFMFQKNNRFFAHYFICWFSTNLRLYCKLSFIIILRILTKTKTPTSEVSLLCSHHIVESDRAITLFWKMALKDIHIYPNFPKISQIILFLLFLMVDIWILIL